MGSCIICGTETDGAVCSIHEEDVAFVFEGDSPHQLTPNRYYRGTVDGYADFGVFINIGSNVTGLLHRNELDRRLESLEWEPGDTVFVQVTNVRENGNVDLSWSTRQSVSAFRGTLIDSPDGEYRRDESETNDVDSTDTTAVNVPDEPEQDSPEPSATETPEYESVSIDTLSDALGESVRVEAEVTEIRQTSGPTVFQVRDATGTVEAAAFEAAGVRAYPAVEIGNFVHIEGTVERHHDELQIETETLTVLDDDQQAAVADRIEAALEERSRPESVTYLADEQLVEPLAAEIRAAATAIRTAITDGRPIVLRHAASVGGYAAGAAIERAVLPRIRDEHPEQEAAYQYFDRRPLDDAVYGMDAVIGDLTNALEICERHDEPRPLFVLVDIGSTAEAIDAFELLELYDIDRVVIDDTTPAAGLTAAVQTVVNAKLLDTTTALSTTALAATVGATIEPEVRGELQWLPAMSQWEDPPAAYDQLATDAGYDDSDRQRIREALAIEAYYQAHNGKRELITDLLFEETSDLVAHISDQYRERLRAELEPARENLTRKQASEVTFVVLDTDKFAHRFDFPPTALLLDVLHREERATVDGPLVTLGVGTDEMHVRSTAPIDIEAIVDRASDVVNGLTAVGGPDGHIVYLTGHREDAIEAVVGAIAARVN